MRQLALALLAATAVQAAQHRFMSFDYPGATFTRAFGINSAGDVVGDYVDSSNVTHGFLLRAGKFTSIDHPGAIITRVRGINANGDMVGNYVDPGGVPGISSNGFVLENGVFTELMYPSHMNTIPQRITDDGLVLGCYHDQDTMGTMHGFAYQRPGSFGETAMQASMHNGALPRGDVIAGLYTDMMTNVQHGYLATKDIFAPFDFPFSIQTAAYDLSPEGEVVGYYTDSAKRSHGFVLSLDESVLAVGIDPQFGLNGAFSFESIDFPAAMATQAYGINARGTVVGSYVDAAGKTHGFVLTRPQPDEDEN